LKFLKQKNPLHMCRNFISIEWHQKYTTKSRETIPLSEQNYTVFYNRNALYSNDFENFEALHAKMVFSS
jgi:hypothetical protein